MRFTRCLSVLLYATIALGFPIRILLTGDTPTIVSERSAISRIQRPAQEPEIPRPSFQEYSARLRSGATDSDIGKTAEAKSAPSDSASGSQYGSFVGKFISNDDPKHASPMQTCNASRFATYLKPADFLDIIDNHGPESVALGLFVLVPIAYFVLELLELAIKSCTRERYPRRGRDRVRLVGPERQLRAWSNQQREILVESEKHWWQARRARC